MRIENDKYYTPREIANFCVQELLKVVDKGEISDVLEPSIGNGAFITPLLPIDTGIDIESCVSQSNINIVTGDFLTMPIEYKKGRLVIGNPPFGARMNMAQKFFKKAVSIGDYVAFILPISQLNNTAFLYEFDLIQSIDLGLKRYTDRELHCCFNIYQRPQNGILNKKQKKDAQCIKIYRNEHKNYEFLPYDIRMCYWGNGSAGRILSEGERYAGEYKIQIIDEHLRKDIIHFLNTFDWNSYMKCIAMRRITQHILIDVLRKNIEGFY